MSKLQKIKSFLLENKTARQTVAKNTFWLFSSEALGRLLKMALVIYAARMLGVSGWGTFSYAISVSSLLMIFSDIGINDIIAREASQKKEGYKTFVSSALLLKCAILSISAIFIIIISPFISHIAEAKTLFPIIAVILFFDSMRELGLSINRIFEKMERDMAVKFITNFTILALGILFLKIKLAPGSIAAAYAIGSTIGFIAIAVLIKNDIKEILSKFDTKLFKSVIKITWPFALITLLGTIMANADIYMLGIWKNSAEIGLYAAVQRIHQFIIIIPSVIGVAAFPLILRLANNDNKKLGLILEKIVSFIMIIGLPIAFGGIILAEDIVHLIFGSEYIEAAPILRIFMLMSLVSFPLVLLSNAIFAYNKQRSLALTYLVGMIANVLLNFFLIPKFGAVGAAIATLASTSIITITIWIKLKTIHQFEILSHLKKAFFSTIIIVSSILIFKYIGTAIVVNIIASSLLYFIFLLLLKEPIFKEVKQIINI